jgi:hypothetical protein
MESMVKIQFMMSAAAMTVLACGSASRDEDDGGDVDVTPGDASHADPGDGAIRDEVDADAASAAPGAEATIDGGSDRDGSTPLPDVITCDVSRIALRGTIDGKEVAYDYRISNRVVGDDFAGYELPMWGRVSFAWNAKLGIGQSVSDAGVELELPFGEDAFSGRAFCSTMTTTTRQSAQYDHKVVQLAEARCPGTAIAGELMVTPEMLTGSLEGSSVSQPVRRIFEQSEHFRVVATRDLIVSTSGPADATAGVVSSGRFMSEDGTRYCIGGGTFTQDTSGAEPRITMKLTNLSRLPACSALPVVGELRACVADPWQLERP